MSIIKRKHREVPRLNTAALPDLIFTVLFFFMIVTHMRTDNLRVKFQQPQGTQLTRLTKKSTTSHIYIGRKQEPASLGQTTEDKNVGESSTVQPFVIQLNDKMVTPADITDLMADARGRMTSEERKTQIVTIKADRHTPIGTLNQVKQALRQAKALNISYNATETEQKTRKNL